MASEQTFADWQDADDSVDRPPQTFEFSKRTFVSGLFWQPLPGTTARQRKVELQKMSKEQGFDLAVLRTTGVPQVGFGSHDDGVKPGMLSVAAMVSKSLEVANRDRSFLCAMPVPGVNKWLYVAQREGVLLHDGDLLGSEEIVRERMMTDLSLIEWQTIFAPDNWGIQDSSQRSFEDLLPKSGNKYSFKKWWEVRSIRNTWLDLIQDNIVLWVSVIAVAVIMGGVYTWNQWRIAQEMEELARQEALVQAARQAAAQEQPWKKEASAPQFVAACDTALHSVKTFWPGNWTPESAVCIGQSLHLTWNREEYGWIEHIRAVEPRVEFSPEADHATLTLPLELPLGQGEAIPRKEERIIALQNMAQRIGIQLDLQPSQAEQVLGQPEVESSWQALDWRIDNTSLSPASLVAVLDGGGFRVKQVTLAFSGGMMTWTMEGTQYVQP